MPTPEPPFDPTVFEGKMSTHFERADAVQSSSSSPGEQVSSNLADNRETHRDDVNGQSKRAEGQQVSNLVAVLLDGDADLFQDRMYARKGSGGREAAHKLFEAVRDWAHQKLGGRREELQIIGLVFMNQRGLGHLLATRKHLLQEPADIAAFVQGFNHAGVPLSIVDTGEPGQTAAIAVQAYFAPLVRSCTRVLLGGCFSSRHARLLLTYPPELRDKVTLLATKTSASGGIDAKFRGVPGTNRRPLDRVFLPGVFSEFSEPETTDAFYDARLEVYETEAQLEMRRRASCPSLLKRVMSSPSQLEPIRDEQP